MADFDWLPTAETTLSDAAVAYASHGFRVHLVFGMRPDGRCQCGKVKCRYPDNKSAGKHPIDNAWQKKTTSDVDAVRDARSKRPNANVGIALGGDARLVAVDIDGDKGRASWALIEQKSGRAAPSTLTQRTGRPDGGEQRIYSLAKRHDLKRLGNRAGFRYPGIDTRVDNGQIVVAPSVHGSGKRYEWILPAAPIAEMPDWLFDALVELPPAAKPAAPSRAFGVTPVTGLDPYLARVLENAARDVATCSEGGRNQLLFAKSCTVFEYFIGENLDHLPAWRVMNDAGLGCGLPAGEVSSVLSKAWRQAQKAPPRKIPPRTTTTERTKHEGQSGRDGEKDHTRDSSGADRVDGEREGVSGDDQSGAAGNAGSDSAARESAGLGPDPGDARPSAANLDQGESHDRAHVGAGGLTSYPQNWEEPSARAWEDGLARTAEGAIKNTFGNVLKILRHAPQFKGRWSYNEMRITPCLDGQPLKDSDVAKVRELVEDEYGIAPAKETTTDAIMGIASERSFHPVQKYLRELTWNGEKRIERIIADIFGGDGDDALSQRMMRAWFVSAVARGLKPGCKVDTSLVLYGEQGFRKSTFFETLGGEWYSNSYVDVRDKDGVLQVHAGWIYEWPEIERITTKRDAADVKAFLTIARDNVRPPYGRGVVNQARSGVIVGTTNKTFLDDETGSRRFHPITIHRRLDGAQLELLTAWRDQLWAEAVAAFEAGETWWLTEDEERARAAVAVDHMVEDAWTEIIASYVSRPGRVMTEVTTLEILRSAICIPIDRIDRGQEARAGKALRAMGWMPRQLRRNGVPIRVYTPAKPVTVVTGVVTDEKAIKSLMSQPSQLSQVDIEFRPDSKNYVPLKVSESGGCDVTPDLTPEDHSVDLSQAPSLSQALVTPNGYPASWDEEGPG